MRADRVPLKGGDEQDVLTDWRRWYTYTHRAGVCAAVKRRYNRRLRRAAKAGAAYLERARVSC